MKYSKITLALAAFAATACAIEVLPETPAENQPEVQLYPMTFTAGADDGSDSETKVTLDGKSVLWAADDQIKVFDGTSAVLPAFTIASGEGTTSASFSGSVADPSTKTYYALYPYQETATYHESLFITENATRTNAIKATIPTEQIAVAGSMPSNAFLSMAVYSEGKFAFKNALSLVKFQIKETDNPSEIEAISLSGNALEYIAGNVGLYLAGKGVNNDYIRGEAKSYVTLTGSFESGEDYFFAIRPVTFSKGITLTVRYKDGTCKYASSANASQSLSRNSVLNLGTLPLVDGLPNDLYIAYLHGQDIDVAGKIINKATYNTAILHKATEDLKTGSGLHFVNDDVTLTYNFDKAVTKLVILGRNKTKRSTLKCASDKALKLNQETDGYAIFHNLIIDQRSATTYFMTVNANQVFETVLFDNCSFEFVTNKNIIYIATEGRGIKNLTISNCDFDSAEFDRVFIAHGKFAVNINNIFVVNNIIKGNSSNSFRISNGSAAIYDNIVFKNNSLINCLTADALFNIKTATKVDIQNNLFYASTAARNMSVVNAEKPTSATTSNNYDYIPKVGDKQFYMKVFYKSYDNFNFTEFTHLNASPFQNPATGEQISEYSTYGAQR